MTQNAKTQKKTRKIGKIDKTDEFMKKYFQVVLSIFMNIPMKN